MLVPRKRITMKWDFTNYYNRRAKARKIFKAMQTTTQPQKPRKTFVKDLYYISYKAQRDLGMSHQQTVNIGLGNEERRLQYEQEKREADESSTDQ